MSVQNNGTPLALLNYSYIITRCPDVYAIRSAINSRFLSANALPNNCGQLIGLGPGPREWLSLVSSQAHSVSERDNTRKLA